MNILLTYGLCLIQIILMKFRHGVKILKKTNLETTQASYIHFFEKNVNITLESV